MPTNDTAIGAGLQQASSDLGADGNPRKVVLLFTDGEQNVPAPDGNVTASGGIKIGGTDYPTGFDVCPITAGQLTAPAFTLQQSISQLRCNNQNLHVANGTQEEFNTFFTQTLIYGVVGDKLEISQDVSSSLNPTDSKTETFLANSQDVAVSILLSWDGGQREGPRLLPFRLTAPDGTVIDTSTMTQVANRMSLTTLRFPLRQGGMTINPRGLWKIDLSGGGPNGQAVTYQIIVINDNATFASDPHTPVQDPGTGEPIPVRVTLTDNGAPVTGATVTASLAGPANGLGDALAKAATPSGTPPPQGGDDLGSAAKQKLLLLLQDPAFRALLADQPLPDLVLTESSPGVYTGTFNGALKEGHIQFVIRSLGTTASNGQFQRLQRVSVYVRPKPDPAKTDLTLLSSLRQPDGSTIIRIKATPRDRFGSLLGPDYLPQLAINSSVGTVSTPIKDNLDGSYEIQYKVPASSPNPDITVVVMGTTVKHLGGSGGGNEKWVISLHVGAAIPHGLLANSFNTGPSVGADLEYRFTKMFSAETFLGYDHFGAAGQDFWFTHLSEYAKVTFGTGQVRPFVDAGLGVYFDSNSTHFGGGAGGGVQFWIQPKFALEGSYNFHAVNSSGSATKYSTVLAGLRFAF